MPTRRLSPIALFAALLSPAVGAAPLPDGFVYLRAVAPEIPQDMRYFGRHNFIGRPIDGYQAPECILTRSAAAALNAVQEDMAAAGLRVKVFDCMDPLSHPDNTAVPDAAQHNRARLAQAMDRHGFRALPQEWWHFTLKAEPFPATYFDFPVTAPGAGSE